MLPNIWHLYVQAQFLQRISLLTSLAGDTSHSYISCRTYCSSGPNDDIHLLEGEKACPRLGGQDDLPLLIFVAKAALVQGVLGYHFLLAVLGYLKRHSLSSPK